MTDWTESLSNHPANEPAPEPFDDVAFMQKEDDWPAWPRLPLKRSRSEGRFPQLGIMVAGRKPEVYLTSMYNKTPLSDVESIKYESFQAVVDAGWRVD